MSEREIYKEQPAYNHTLRLHTNAIVPTSNCNRCAIVLQLLLFLFERQRKCSNVTRIACNCNPYTQKMSVVMSAIEFAGFFWRILFIQRSFFLLKLFSFFFLFLLPPPLFEVSLSFSFPCSIFCRFLEFHSNPDT